MLTADARCTHLHFWGGLFAEPDHQRPGVHSVSASGPSLQTPSYRSTSALVSV